MKNLLLILFVSLIVLSCSVKENSKWQAQWIGLEKEDPNSWICYRKTINLNEIPIEALTKIACDSKYWLWINGKLVVFEGQLKRGPTPDDTYYDAIDIQTFLIEGDNTIAVLVWYFGKHGFSHNSSGKAALIFDAEIDGERFVSDSTWKVKLHPAYGNTTEPFPNYRLSEHNIRFDAQKDISGWEQPGFYDLEWDNAKQFGTSPVAPWNNLVLRPILQWKNSGLLAYSSEMSIVTTDSGEKLYITKMPGNIQATPYFKINAPAGIRIEIKTDNYRGGGTPNLRTEYITKKGVQEFESLSWINGHEMIYSIPDEVEVLDLKYRETGYNAKFSGSFSCDDEKLNTFYEKAVRTLYITMRDNYMDCPDRERAQWWGDAVNEIGEAFYVFDAENGPKLAKKAMYELMLWQRTDSTIYSPVPSGRVLDEEEYKKNSQAGHWNRELPRQMLASVGWYGFWTYYLYTGDKQTIVDLYPRVKDYLNVWKLGKDGLVVHRPGEWDWTDWGDNKDVPVIENTWIYLALKAGVEMAILTGNQSDILGFQNKMNSIENNFNTIFWEGDKYRSPNYKGETDDRANAMAVVAGLAKPEFYPAILEVLKTEFHASPYMEKYVGEALYLMDVPEQAIDRIKARWQAQIASPISTLWEGWGLGNQGFGGGTYNHAWSGGPLTLLCQYGAGVFPLKPGFEEFSVLPQMGQLNQIDLVVPVPDGEIDLKLSKNEKEFEMNLTVPINKKAFLGVPQSQNFKISKIEINGNAVWEKGKSGRKIKGIEYKEEDGKYIYFFVESGNWRIRAN